MINVNFIIMGKDFQGYPIRHRTLLRALACPRVGEEVRFDIVSSLPDWAVGKIGTVERVTHLVGTADIQDPQVVVEVKL